MTTTLTVANYVLMAATYTSIPLKFVPMLFWSIYQLAVIITHYPWSNWDEIWTNICNIFVTFISQGAVYMMAGLFLPIDAIILYDAFIIPLQTKLNTNDTNTTLRILSWVGLGFGALVSALTLSAVIAYSLATNNAWVSFDTTSGMMTSGLNLISVAAFMTPILGMITPILYAFQVNSYNPYV